MRLPTLHPKTLKRVRYAVWLTVVGYWALLGTMTHLPPRYMPHVEVSDKLEHFLAYGLLAGLLGLTTWVTFPRRPWLVWTVLILGLAYGALDELTQPLFHRDCEFEDWIADAVGTMAGMLPVLFAQRFVRLPVPPVADEIDPDAPLGAEVEAALDACTR